MMVRLRRYWIQLTADRRKFGTLCTMLGIGLLLWARLLVVSNMPKTAIADDQKVELLDEGEPITNRASGSESVLPVVDVMLDERPKKDPFAISSAYFPKTTQLDEFSTEPEKSTIDEAEDPELAEARLLLELEALAEAYSLEAAMSGASLAVIDGRTYRKGDTLHGKARSPIRFTLAEVEQRTVVLEYEGHRFELRMIRPGG